MGPSGTETPSTHCASLFCLWKQGQRGASNLYITANLLGHSDLAFHIAVVMYETECMLFFSFLKLKKCDEIHMTQTFSSCKTEILYPCNNYPVSLPPVSGKHHSNILSLN